MVTQFEDVANQVAQQKIGNARLRNEAIRKGMADPWSAPKEASKPTQLQDVTKGTGTLADTYSRLLNNANVAGYTSSGSTPSVNNYNSSKQTGRMPSWMPSIAGKGVGILSGNGLYGALTQLALQTGSGDWKGAAAGGAGLLASNLSQGKLPGIGGFVGTAVNHALRSTPLQAGQGEYDRTRELGIDLGNSALGTLAGLNPALGTVYGLARLFGFDPIRGSIDNSKSDASLRNAAGYNGGYFASNRGSWSPTAPYNTTGTYSGSGYGNTAGPGSGSNGTPTNYTASTQHYGYSNPASSYAGQTSSNSDSGED